MVFFKQIKVGRMDNFNYVIGDEDSKIAALVDPSWEEEKLYDICEAEGYDIEMILITHTHFDHIEAVERIVEKTGAKIYIHANEKEAIENIDTEIITVDDGDIIEIGKVKVKVHFTPGHTPGGITFQVEKKLITGDLLFVEGCGRTDLEGGDSKVLFESLQKIKAMPDYYEIYPGHDYGSKEHSTIAWEKKHNGFLQSDTVEEFMDDRG